MSSAKARFRSSSTIALPPYLITTVLPWNCSSQGRASVSTAAFARARRCFSLSVNSLRVNSLPVDSLRVKSSVGVMGVISARVGGVLVHVRVGQVVGPDRRALGAGLEVDGDADLPRPQVDQL